MGKLQLDMFEAPEGELFPSAPVVDRPDPDRVRRRLDRMLVETRAAAPLSPGHQRRRFLETVLPQMLLALPDDEAGQYRLDFAAELAKLG